MSNASDPSDSTPSRISQMSAGESDHETHPDLWDEGSEPGSPPVPDPTKSADSTLLPPRRDDLHFAVSNLPSGHNIDPGEKPLAREKAMMGERSENFPPSEDTSVTHTTLRSIGRSFTTVEKISVSALALTLILAASLGILHFSNSIPTQSILRQNLEFPISGKLVKVTALDTFWRKPVTTGKNPDVVRRGTELIPVVTLKVESGKAAVRVLFCDGAGSVIGDPINRTVSGKTELTLPATAGFDDIGMHAAYRTGASAPWSIHILEAKESGLPVDQFHEVLKSEISPDIH